MKKNNTLWLLLLALSSLFAACKKDAPQDELSKLPPATQTGANTFGCLVNGKAWVAQSDCRFLCDASFKLQFDVRLGGIVSVDAVHKNAGNNINQSIVFSMDSTNHFSSFDIIQRGKEHVGFTFFDHNSFIRSWDSLVICTGKVIFSKYDLQNDIIAGTFEFSLTKPGVQTINVTSGRFDYKF